MKRFILMLALAAALLCSLVTPKAAGAEESAAVSIVPTGDARNLSVVTVTWVSAADGSKADVPIDAANLAGYCAMMAVTDPGATAPTDNYDITLKDSLGADIFGGALANRDETASEQAMPLIGGAYGCRAVDENGLTMTLSGNSVDSGNGVVKFYFRRIL